MKIILYLILLVTYSYGQQPNADFELLNCKPVKGNYLWAATTELSNFQYLEFLTYLKKNNDLDTYNKMLPDTNKWKDKLNYNEPYVNYYFRHPAYRDYPMVNITKIQAEAYCEWLEKILNEVYSKNTKHPIQKLDVRLPTKEEWETAAKAGNPNAIFPWDGENMRREDKKFKGQIRANYVRGRGDYLGAVGNLNDNADVTAPVLSYWPNEYGLYNMSGNVEEMIQEEGRTKGGSWRSRAPFLEIAAEDENNGTLEAKSTIGFRYFVEIISFKPVKQKKEFEFSAKMVEKLLVEISDTENLMACKYEVTNLFYSLYLKENPNIEKPQNSLWANELNYSRRIQNDYGSYPKYDDYPVVNITKENASDFCLWLTKKYKEFPNRKYKNITFRLPTQEEWEVAASGGLKQSPYPWGGPYIRNSKGDLLCNHRPAKERWILDKGDNYLKPGIPHSDIIAAGNLDGFLFSSPVESYYPNGYGLYNVSGNVAEIISDGEVTKGGSWGSNPYYVQIKSTEPYSGASPFVGFRFFAEIK